MLASSEHADGRLLVLRMRQEMPRKPLHDLPIEEAQGHEMTVGELMAELIKWPPEALVYAFEEIVGIGMFEGHPIVKVSGGPGGHISGRDICVEIQYRVSK